MGGRGGGIEADGHRGSGKGVGMGGVFDFCYFAVKWEGRRKSTTHLMDRNGLITNNGKWAKQGFSFSSSVDLVLLVTGRRLKVTKYDTELAVCVSDDNKYDTELAVCVSDDNKYDTELAVCLSDNNQYIFNAPKPSVIPECGSKHYPCNITTVRYRI